MIGIDFSALRVLVVGDVMLDSTLIGQETRRSPETGVPVLEIGPARFSPGGAANAAANVRALGADCTLVGVVGSDPEAEVLREVIAKAGVSEQIVVDDRPTTVKLRISTPDRALLRCDRESRAPLNGEPARLLLQRCSELLKSCDLLLISDYAKGVCSSELCRQLIAQARCKPVVVDPKNGDWGRYVGATVLKPNLVECATALGCPCEDDERAIATRLEPLRQRFRISTLAVTRGRAGMTILGDHAPISIPTLARSVVDVTGAGDTVAAALALCVATGVPVPTAAVLASVCAALAVEHPGTIGVSAAALRERLRDSAPDILPTIGTI